MNNAYYIAAALGAAAYLLSRNAEGRGVLFSARHYEPGSLEAIRLFERAADAAGLPQDWAGMGGLHSLLRKESKGWVGIPNYTYGKVKNLKYIDQWPAIWKHTRKIALLRRSKGSNVSLGHSSSATGLGQLLALPVWKNGKIRSSGVEKYYPDGLYGIGDPFNEAVGMLRYIASRYGSPEIANSMHNRQGKYVNPLTGKTRIKTFTEGY